MQPQVEALLLEKITVDLHAKGFEAQAAVVKRAIVFSMPDGTVQPMRFCGAMLREMATASDVIFESLQQVVNSVDFKSGDSLGDDLFRVFNSEFDRVWQWIQSGFSPSFRTNYGIRDFDGQLEQYARDAKRKKKVEIQLLVEKNMKDKATLGRTVTTLTIQNSQIGILQAGDRNSITDSTVNFGAAEKKSLAETMRAIAERLEHVDSLNETEKEDLRDVAFEAETELQKPRSNWTRLRGLLSTVFVGIEGIAALSDLYEMLKLALPAVGIHVG